MSGIPCIVHLIVEGLTVVGPLADANTLQQRQVTLLNEDEVRAVAILHIAELRLRSDDETHGHRRPAHRRDGLVGNGDFFAIHVSDFNDASTADALRLYDDGLFVHRHTGIRAGGPDDEHRTRN